MKIIDLVQGSDAWLEYRKNKIGSSDIATIMRLNPFKSPYKLFQEKTGVITPFVNDKMRRGVELEPTARREVNENLEANYNPICVEHEVHEFMFASLDGWDAKSQIRIIEIKCPGEETHRIALSDQVPTLYYPQLQFQMYVTDSQSAYYVSYMPEDLIPLPIVLVKRDDEFCERMVKAAHEFHMRRINFDPPEPSEKEKEPTVINDEKLIRISMYREKCKQQMDELAESIKEFDEKLKLACKGEISIIGNLKITKSIRKGCIDYDAIEELKHIDLDKYRKASKEVWTIKEIKNGMDTSI